MATSPVGPQPNDTEKKRRHRSPNYPAVGLREAIDRVRKFMTVDGRAGATPEIAAKHIGYASAHGQAYSVLAALKKFGLAEDKDGRIVPTQRAIEIISLPENDLRRTKAIRDAALLPSVYVELIEQYRKTGLPSDETLEGELKAYRGFNPNAVKEFLKGFRETLEFAGLSDLDALSPQLKIGDFVQWEHNGVLGLPEARRIRGFSEDEQFAFVEGDATGLPLSELIPTEPPAATTQPAPPSPARMTEARSGIRVQGKRRCGRMCFLLLKAMLC